MKVKYRAINMWSMSKIEKVEIVRETEKFIFLKSGRRESKLTEYHSYFETWDEAKEHLVTLAQNAIKSTQSTLDSANELLKKISNISREDME